MFGKKPSAPASVGSKESKLDVLKSIMGDMDSRMKGGLADKKAMKVSVAADSPTELEAGLEKAQEFLPGEESEDEMGADQELDTMCGDKSVPELEEMLSKIQSLIDQKKQLLVK